MKTRSRGWIAPQFEIGLAHALHLASAARVDWRRADPIERMLYAGMAETMPEEGLDIILGQFPKNATRLTSTWLGTFSSQTASTVITDSQTISNLTESVWTNYARQELAAATWGAQADVGSTGRSTTYPQVTLPTVGATGGTVNGFFIADIESTSGDKAIGVANFNDLTAVVLAENDVLKITPTIQLNH